MNSSRIICRRFRFIPVCFFAKSWRRANSAQLNSPTALRPFALAVIHEIISEREIIGEPIAHKLEEALDISAQFWLNADDALQPHG